MLVADSETQLAENLMRGDRSALARAITLCESAREEDRQIATRLLHRLLPHTGKSVRIGITGVPGVGKSTLIETWGLHLLNQHHRVAVLTVDPTSQRTRGSILADKTRMEMLSREPGVFIRPSPSGQTLGGVNRATRESILLCEAAGYDIILIETVGVGQSETDVRGMVDFFLLLLLAGAGDELQGIKKGIMEMADAVAITKADGDNIRPARQARADALQALHMQAAPENGWKIPVLETSATTGSGMAELTQTIDRFAADMKASGWWDQNRQQQHQIWFEESLAQQAQAFLLSDDVRAARLEALKAVISGEQLPSEAAAKLLKNLLRR